MRKYRIITNGSLYKIQFRCFGFWRAEKETIHDRDGDLRRQEVVMRTTYEAENWMETRKSAGWRVLK